MNDLTKAQKNKDKLYAGSTKEQQILATTKGKKSYVYQNMLLTQETKNLKEQNKHRQKALKETRDSYMKAKNRYDIADADKTKSQNKLLNNKTVMSKLNKTQQKALKAGKTVSTKGITDPKVLKWIQDYNEKVKKSKNEESNVNIASVFDNVTFNLPNVIDSNAFVRELVTNKKAERAIQAMTIDRIRGGSSLAKNKYKH